MKSKSLKTMFQSGCALLLLVFVLVSSPVTAQSRKIKVGDNVEVVTSNQNLNLRSGPGLNYPVVTKLPNGTHMTVIDGPKKADNFTWWKLDGSRGQGWSVEKYLRVVASGGQTDEKENQVAETPLISDERCEQLLQVYDGIQHCIRDNQQTHLLIIDLNDPHIRFQTVFANDDRNVQTTKRQTIPEMAEAHPATAAAINADYFGGGHGPEGLTISDGIRYDGIKNGDNDAGAVNRSSLVISKTALDGGTLPITAQVTRLSEDDQVLAQSLFFNAAGGGPQVIFNGAWEWDRGTPNAHHNGCSPTQRSDGKIYNEDIINGECFVNSSSWGHPDTRWTAFAITQDQKMLWLVAPYGQVRGAMQDFKAQNAIKMDGGGSSQLWLNGQTVVKSSDPGKERRVASGLLVYYLHAFEVMEQSNFPIIISGESVKVNLILRNTGSDTWTYDNYALSSEKNPWNKSFQLKLNQTVGPGGVLEWGWQSDPIEGWGIKTIELQMWGQGQPFPEDALKINVVVLPESVRDQKEKIQKQVNEWLAEGVENIEQLIVELITQYINRSINDCVICRAPLMSILIAIGFILLRIKR